MDVSIEFKITIQEFNRLFLRALNENFERFDFTPQYITSLREFLLQELTRQSYTDPKVDFSSHLFARQLVGRMCQEVCVNMDGMMFYTTSQDRLQMVKIVEEAFVSSTPPLGVFGALEPKS